MVLAILALLWIIVLAPTAFRKFKERESTESIDTFHRELHLLERAGPRLMARAHGLSSRDHRAVSPAATGLPSVSSKPGRPKLVLLPHPPSDDPGEAEGASGVPVRANGRAGRPVDRGRTGSGPRRMQEGARRASAYKRRRDLLVGLTGTFLVTAVAGSVHALRPLWVITFLCAVGLGGYVLLVQQARRLRAERRAEDRLRAQMAAAYDPGRAAQRASAAAPYAQCSEADLLAWEQQRAWEEQQLWEEQRAWSAEDQRQPRVAMSR